MAMAFEDLPTKFGRELVQSIRQQADAAANGWHGAAGLQFHAGNKATLFVPGPTLRQNENGRVGLRLTPSIAVHANVTLWRLPRSSSGCAPARTIGLRTVPRQINGRSLA